MDKERLLKKLVLLGEAYTHFVPKPNTYALYIEALSDMDEEVLDQAIKQCLMTCKYYPTIAEIRESAIKIMTSNIADAYSEWQKVVRAARLHGSKKEVKFDNKITQIVVKTIGWDEICLGDSDNLKFTFIKIYEKIYNEVVNRLSYECNYQKYNELLVSARSKYKMIEG